MNQSQKKKPATIRRRTLLHGLAGGLLLPFLPSIAPKEARSQETPSRFVWLFSPNGFHTPRFRPESFEPGFALSPILQPLERHRSRLSVLSGLHHESAKGNGDVHIVGLPGLLTSVAVDPVGVRAGISVDQVIADHLAGQTPLKSLELAVSQAKESGSCQTHPCLYRNRLSWAAPETPLPPIVDPWLAFERVFGSRETVEMEQGQRARQVLARRSILDGTSSQVKQIAAQSAADDRIRLDEYLTGLRELEQKLDALDSLTCEATPLEFDETHPQRLQALMDVIVQAFACDVTRVASLMMDVIWSGLAYTWVDSTGGYHNVSHHQKDETNIDEVTRIQVWIIEQVAAFLDKLEQRGLLDDTVVFLGSEIGEGHLHNLKDMPILVMGGGAGHRGDRHLDLDGRPVADVHLAFLQAAGVSQDTFGTHGTQAVELFS